jgi:hypothetical protein
MIVFLSLVLWVIANKINVNSDGDIDWECAAAVAIIIPLASHFLNDTSWLFCFLLAIVLFSTNWLYFKISGHTNSITGFIILIFPGILICLLVPYFLVDHSLEYRYWKKAQEEAIEFAHAAIMDVKSNNKTELENELKSLTYLFENKKSFSSNHDRVQKLARMYILNEAVGGQNVKPFAFHEPYIKVYPDGLALVCHYDLLVLLYEQEAGLPQLIRNDGEFNNVCYGWNELDHEVTFWSSPHADSTLRY